MAAVVSEYPMPKDCQMYSLIGMNLNDGTLRPERKNGFIALIDFERPGNMQERAVQISSLEETKTRYIVLNGEYSIAEIREIYRQCGIYFIAHRESFGLPICELQACGAYIFTPYANWCPSHWIKNDLFAAGPGELSSNFIVYDNDKTKLLRKINYIKNIYEPQVVFDNFVKNYPQLFYGDMSELEKFIIKVQKGEIHSQSHKEYPNLGSLVNAIGL
jgi:hypothetical protein